MHFKELSLQIEVKHSLRGPIYELCLKGRVMGRLFNVIRYFLLIQCCSNLAFSQVHNPSRPGTQSPCARQITSGVARVSFNASAQTAVQPNVIRDQRGQVIPYCPGVDRTLGYDHSASNCSATLVADNIMYTAGHCLFPGGDQAFAQQLSAEDICARLNFHFDQPLSQGSSAESVACSEILYFSPRAQLAGSSEFNGGDFALIRINRRMPDSRVLPFQPQTIAQPNFRNSVIAGYPQGGNLVTSQLGSPAAIPVGPNREVIQSITNSDLESQSQFFNGFHAFGMSGGPSVSENCEVNGHYWGGAGPRNGLAYNQSGRCVDFASGAVIMVEESRAAHEILSLIQAGELQVTDNTLNVIDPNRYTPGVLPEDSLFSSTAPETAPLNSQFESGVE